MYAGGSLQVAHACAAGCQECGLQPHAQVGAYVERRQLRIHVCVDDSQQVHACKGKDAHVTVFAEIVLFVLEYLFETLLFPRDVIAQREHLLVALGVGVIVHDVEIGLAVVAQHLAVPCEGVGTSQKTAVEDGQFPVFTVVYLSASGKHKSQPHGTYGVGTEGLLFALGKDCLQQAVREGAEAGGVERKAVGHGLQLDRVEDQGVAFGLWQDRVEGQGVAFGGLFGCQNRVGLLACALGDGVFHLLDSLLACVT